MLSIRRRCLPQTDNSYFVMPTRHRLGGSSHLQAVISRCLCDRCNWFWSVYAIGSIHRSDWLAVGPNQVYSDVDTFLVYRHVQELSGIQVDAVCVGFSAIQCSLKRFAWF